MKHLQTLLRLTAIFLAASVSSALATTLVTYPAPTASGAPTLLDYGIISAPSSTTQSGAAYDGSTVSSVWMSKNYTVTVNGTASPVYFYQSAMTYFDFSGGPVTVKVTVNASVPVSSAVIRPKRLGITPQVSGQTITFTLSQPQNLDVEVNNDTNNPLFVFANPIDTTAPTTAQIQGGTPTQGGPHGYPIQFTQNSTSVLYYGPGIYTITDLNLSSNTEVYIAGGAIVYGHFSSTGTSNVSVKGRGIIAEDDTMYMNCNGLTLDGYIVTSGYDPGHWTTRLGACQNVTINNYHSYPWQFPGWGQDGLDLSGCQTLTMSNSCIRCVDDCISIKSKSLTNGSDGNVLNHEIYNSVFWSTGQNAFEIGFELDCPLVNNIYYHDNDIIHYSGGKAALGIHNIGWGTTPSIAEVKNVLYENINIEDCSNDIVDLIEAPNLNGADGTIHDITFRNVALTGGSNPGSIIQIAGDYSRNQSPEISDPGTTYTAGHTAQNITFENFQILGQVILNPASGGFRVGGNTSDILFTATGRPPSSISSLSSFNEILSPNGEFSLLMQADGNLVEYNATSSVWSSKTYQVGMGPYTAKMQADGNLVVYQYNGTSTWSTGTWNVGGVAPFQLSVQNNGQIMLIDANSKVLFSTPVVSNPSTNPAMLLPTSVSSGSTFTQLASPDNQYEILMQPDGNFVEYSGSLPVWSSATYMVGNGPYEAIMQNDGNLVVYQQNGSATWASGTWTEGSTGYPYHFEMEDDVSAVLYDKSGAALFSTEDLY